MTDSRREIKDVFYLVALQGVNYVMPLVVLPYLMVVLGSDRFGLIGFSTGLAQLFMLIVDFGFNFTATKEVALYKDDPVRLRQVFWDTLYAKLGLLVVSFVLYAAVLLAVPRFAVYRHTAFIFFLMVVANAFSFVWYFQGLGKIRFISIANVAAKLLILPLVFWLVKGPDDYLLAALIQSGVYVFSSLIVCGLLVAWRMVPGVERPDRGRIRACTRSSFPIFLSQVASSLYVALFAVILGYFALPAEVGKYTAAEKIMRSACYLVFTPVAQAFYPKMSVLARTDRAEAKRLLKRIAAGVGVVMLGVFGVLFFFSDVVMQLLGKDYEGIETIFRILAIVPLFVALGGVCGQLGLLALGDECDKRHYQHVYFAGAAVALVSILALVPQYGAAGAAWALLVTEVVVCGGMVSVFCRNKNEVMQ